MSLVPRKGWSLYARIALALTSISLAAVVIAGGLLYLQFKSSDRRMREHTLRADVTAIRRALRFDAAGVASLDETTREGLAQTGVRYAVADAEGVLLLASPGVTQPLLQDFDRPARAHSWLFRRRGMVDYFSLGAEDGRRVDHGVSQSVAVAGRSLWVQVVSSGEDVHLDSLIEEYLDHFAWVWAPLVLALLLANLWVVQRALRPLQKASAVAAAIGPDTIAARLPESGLPDEILPLVQAVNMALSRLEQGYQAQQAFVADVAHELRTPLAVLRARLDVAGSAVDPGLRGPFLADIAQMERVIGQLLDLARLDGVEATAFAPVDLTKLCQDVASQLAVVIIRRGCAIEVIAADPPIRVSGHYDSLYRAVRNLTENALRHSPPGGTITLTVAAPAAVSVRDQGLGVPASLRDAVFRRFWRAGDDRRRDRATSGGDGAGLGLAIAAEAMRRHGGAVEIADAPNGGALLTLRFPD